MEGTTKNTNSRANMTDTKIALGLLKQQRDFKVLKLGNPIRGKKDKNWVHASISHMEPVDLHAIAICSKCKKCP